MVGLDIGSSKVCAAVGEELADGTINILGIGEAPSVGVRHGEIINAEAATHSMRQALVAAENKSDVRIRVAHLAMFNGPAVHNTGRIDKNTLQFVESLQIAEGIKLEICDVALRPLASSCAVLDPEQHKLGALVIDLGSDTTSHVLLAEDAIKDFGWQSVGGSDVTNDLSTGLRIPFGVAERLKVEHGSAMSERFTGGDRIMPDCRTAAGESHRIGDQIIHLRMQEIFAITKARIDKTGVPLAALGAGIHLTGGGAMMRGVGELAQEVFGVPVHLTLAKGISGAGEIGRPDYACAIGLLRLSAGSRRTHPESSCERRHFWILPDKLA